MFRSYTDIVRVSREPTGTNVELPLKASEDEARYICDFCDLCWHTELDLEIHRKKSHLSNLQRLARNQHVCLICVRKQDSAKSLIEHVKSEHLLSSPSAERVQREIFICNHCKNIFFNKALLILHIQYIHKELAVETHQCPKCHKAIKRKNIWGHLQLHTLNFPSACPICLTQCQSKIKRRVHMKSHPYHLKCDMCMYTTSKEKHFAEHIMTRHTSNQRDVSFDNIGRYFVTGQRHNTWQYRPQIGVKGLKLYHVSICVLCRQMCSSARSMRRHAACEHAVAVAVAGAAAAAASGERAGGRACKCGARFSHGVLLKQHVFRLRGDHRPLEDEETEHREKQEGAEEEQKHTPSSTEDPTHVIDEGNISQTPVSFKVQVDACEESYQIFEVVSTDNTEQLVEVYAVQEEVAEDTERVVLDAGFAFGGRPAGVQ